MRDFQCCLWREALGFAGLFGVNCEGRSGGLMLMWKAPVSVSVLSYSSGHIDSMIQHGEKNWRFTGFYGNPEACKRHISWSLLCRLSCMHEIRDLPWLVDGDFNEIYFDTEKWGGNPRPLSQTRAFRESLDVCSLQDLHGSGEFFTSFNRSSSNNLIFERLDRYVATFAWRMLYPSSQVQSLDFYHSDHRPILIELGGSQSKAAKSTSLVFRFESHWATEEDLVDVVHRGWDKNNRVTTIHLRLKGCKDTLRAWASAWFGFIPRQLLNKRNELAQLRTQDQWQKSSGRTGILEREVEVLAAKDELYWKQRTGLTGLRMGIRILNISMRVRRQEGPKTILKA